MKKRILTAIAAVALFSMPANSQNIEYLMYDGPHFSFIYPSNWKQVVGENGSVVLEYPNNKGAIAFTLAKSTEDSALKEMVEKFKAKQVASGNSRIKYFQTNDLISRIKNDPKYRSIEREYTQSALETLTQFAALAFMYDAVTKGELPKSDLDIEPTVTYGQGKFAGIKGAAARSISNRPTHYIEVETVYITKKGLPFICVSALNGKSEKSLGQVRADIETIKANWEWKK